MVLLGTSPTVLLPSGSTVMLYETQATVPLSFGLAMVFEELSVATLTSGSLSAVEVGPLIVS